MAATTMTLQVKPQWAGVAETPDPVHKKDWDQTSLYFEMITDPKPQWAQTYVIKADVVEKGWLKHLGWRMDAHAWALFIHYSMESELESKEIGSSYIVITMAKGSNTNSTTRHIKELLTKYGAVNPQWLGPFTERFYSLLAGARRWGPRLEELWYHPISPTPFFILKQEKPSDEEKIAWILQEVAGDVEIGEFCAKFLQLFGSNFSTEVAQKSTALRLFGLHQGRKLKKGVDLPAEELEQFELAWNPEAPARCRRCLNPAPGVPSVFNTPFCGDKCRLGSLRALCRKCDKPATLKQGWRICEPCGQRVPAPIKPADTPLKQTLKRSLDKTQEILRIGNNTFKYKLEPCDAMQKKRRRT